MTIEGDVREIGREFNRVHFDAHGGNQLMELRTWGHSLPSPVPSSKTLHYGNAIKNEVALDFAIRISESTGQLSEVRSDDFANTLGIFLPMTGEGISGIHLNLDGVMAFASWLMNVIPETELMGRSSSRGSSIEKPDKDPRDKPSLNDVYAKAFDLAANCAKELILIDVHVEFTWMWLAQVMPVATLTEIYDNAANSYGLRHASALRLMRNGNAATKSLSSKSRKAIFESLGLDDFGPREMSFDTPNALLITHLEAGVLSSIIGKAHLRSGDSIMNAFIASPFEPYFRRNVSWFSYNRGLTHDV